MKRAIDLALGTILLVASSPVLAVAALAIRLDSPGPAIFRQARVGRDGMPFTCLKLRSMRLGTPSVPTHEADKQAVTGPGRIMRRLKVDEIPQLWNVIRGEMSLVGPRPCLPTQLELVEFRRALGVLALRPGITGLAQIRGIDMSEPRRCAEADAEYASRSSLFLDAKILWGTLWAALSGPALVPPT